LSFRVFQLVGATGSGLLLCILVGSVLGFGSYTFYYAEGSSYFSNDPRACVNCHIMREHYDGWQTASHHVRATCNDCHIPQDFIGKHLVKAENGYRHSEAFTLQNFHEPIRIRPRNASVLEANCIHCHRDLVQSILGPREDFTGCVRCHPSVGHGPPR
jgi:cytochrome c nitrite reductase small subunit